MLKQKIIGQIKLDIQKLALKKLWIINENGHKVKVRRDTESAYSIYLDGYFITTLSDCDDTVGMVLTLLVS